MQDSLRIVVMFSLLQIWLRGMQFITPLVVHTENKIKCITVGQLKDPQHVRKMISDEEMYTIFKKIEEPLNFLKTCNLMY